MTRVNILLVSATLLVSFVVWPIDASAQWYRKYHRDDVGRAIVQAEKTSDAFVKVFDRNLDKSALNDSEREDKLNEKAKDLENKLDRLDRDFKGRTNWWESREAAQDALFFAKGINNSVRARRYSPECEQMWWRLRSDLNQIARYFNLAQLPR